MIAGIVIIIICFIIFLICLYEGKIIKRSSYTYLETKEALRNPMMGFAPNADYVEAVGDNTLVYVDVTWRELEPEEGSYDFDAIKEENFISMWKQKGKKAVLRFVCDNPGSKEHMDIPDWLYEKTKDGTFYDGSYGKGYSPNYKNETFIKYHEKAIEALGAEFGQDDFVCFVELGSIGHWGEWHTKYDEGIARIPSEEICREYVIPYLSAFPNAKILMRRPFSFVSEYGFGVYNDMTGEPDDTNTWLGWIQNGSIYKEAEQPMQLPACKDIWKTAPVGGEFTSSIPMADMLGTQLEQTLELLQQSHMTFIGPKCPIANDEEINYPEATQEILKNIGYRYGVTKAKLRYNKLSHKLTIKLELKNYGVAPMYFSWPVCLYFLSDDGKIQARYETDVDLEKLAGGETLSVSITEDYTAPKSGEELPLVAIGIENPQTGLPEVKLAMDVEAVDCMYMLD